jgi:mRNA interferase MazF/mRNA interferase ChpB
MHPSAGREKRGRHAGLIISASKFNYATGFAFIAPITTVGNASRGSNFAIPLAGTGTGVTGVVQVDQVKSIDWRNRNAEKSVDTIPDEILTEVLERFAPIFGLGLLEPGELGE